MLIKVIKHRIKMTQIDVITIGAGGGAYPAAFRLAKAGKKVIMIDIKGVMSGNCLAEGCVPSKALREVTGIYKQSRFPEKFGLSGALKFSYKQMVSHKDYVQDIRYNQHQKELEEFPDNIQLIKGKASLVDSHKVSVETESGNKIFLAQQIIIASGADIVMPPIKGAELCITSRDVYALHPNLSELPKSLTIIGGGYIGLETASIFCELGVKVTVIEMMGRILPTMEPRLSEELQRMLNPNIKIILNAKVEEVNKAASGFDLSFVHSNQKKTINSELVMMAIGRHPVIPEGITEIGIKTEKGRILVNNALQTNFSHIYAPGDVNGRSMLFHSAVRQSLVVANNILAGNVPIDYMNFEAVPATVFTFPEMAFVGVLPSAAKERGISLIETAYSFKGDSRAQIYDEREGEIREFFDKDTMKLIGAWVIGIDAANLIGELGLAVQQGLTVFDLARYADQHPMASEGISKAARKLM